MTSPLCPPDRASRERNTHKVLKYARAKFTGVLTPCPIRANEKKEKCGSIMSAPNDAKHDVIKSIVFGEIVRIAKLHNKPLVPLSADLALQDSGLDSLCIAVLIVCLNDRTGYDPFDRDDEGSVPVTVGDIVRLYENSAI
jgi:hypothetical protein